MTSLIDPSIAKIFSKTTTTEPSFSIDTLKV
jgi:hypothetical protein